MDINEEKQLVSLLSALKAGFLPYEVFVEIARLVVLSIIEFVPLRLNEKGETQVLLLSRGMRIPSGRGCYTHPEPLSGRPIRKAIFT